MQETNDINQLAIKHGITDVDYFKYSYNEAKGKENFNADSFVDGMKESKPYVFGKVATPATDNSGNKGDNQDMATKVKGLSFKELQELQNRL